MDIIKRSNKLKPEELLEFFKNINIFFKYGLTLNESINYLYKTIRSPFLKKVINELNFFLSKGNSFSDFILKTPYFPKEYYSIIKAGEESATLASVREGELSAISGIIVDLERKIGFRKKLVNALLMPGITFVIVIFIIFILLTFLLPQILSSLIQIANDESDIPKVTLIVYDIVRYYNHNRIIIFILLGLMSGFVILSIINQKYLYNILGLKMFKIPLIGTLYKYNFYLNLFSTIHKYTKTGSNISQALTNIISAEKNIQVIKILSQINKRVKMGNPLHKVMSQYAIFDPIIVTSLQQSEIGGLAERLEFLIDYYNKLTDDYIEKIKIFIQPATVILLGVIIGSVFISIIASIYSFIQNVGSGMRF